MANSKRRVVLNYVRDTTLAQITVANGYKNNLKTRKRGLEAIDNLPVSKFPALFITGANEERQNITRNQFLGKIHVLFVGYVKNKKGTDAAQDDLDDLIGDLTRALETDRTLGGNANWLEIKSVSVDDGDMGNFAAFAIPVDINYTTEGITP